MKDLIELRGEWYWPKVDNIGVHGAWMPLTDEHAKTPYKIAEKCKARRVIVQAGGNCGAYIKKYAELFDHVYTFEPHPVNFYCLNLNVTEPNVHKFQAAVGYERNLVCVKNDINFGDGTNNAGAYYVREGGNIPTLRIDDLNLQVCDAIQLDIEGFEYFALRGAEETIKRCRPIIVLEFCWEIRYNITKEQVDSYLISLGYDPYDEIEDTQGDHLYLPRE